MTFGGLGASLKHGRLAPCPAAGTLPFGPTRKPDDMAVTTWWVVSVLLIVAGLAGTVLPALPGTALVLAGIVLGAWIDDFTRVGWVTLTVVGVLAVLSWVLEYLAGLMGAKRAGASPLALVGATVGTVAGLFMGLVGVLVLPFVGAVVGELIARRDQMHALKVGVGTWLGLMLGMLAKVVLCLMMVGVFVVALFW